MAKHENLIKYLNKHQYKGIIFDFDGTLYKLLIDWSMLKKDLFYVIRELTSQTPDDTPLIKVLFKYRKEIPQLYEKLKKIYQDYEILGFKEGKVNRKLLSFINQRSRKKFAIYSMSTGKVIAKFLKKYNLQEAFSYIISQDNAYAAKPFRSDLEKIIKFWNFNNKEILIVGNSNYDIQSGEMTNIRALLIESF